MWVPNKSFKLQNLLYLPVPQFLASINSFSDSFRQPLASLLQRREQTEWGQTKKYLVAHSSPNPLKLVWRWVELLRAYGVMHIKGDWLSHL